MSSIDSLPKCLQQLAKGQTEAMSQKLHPDNPHKCQGPKHVSHYLLPSKAHCWEAGLEADWLGLEVVLRYGMQTLQEMAYHTIPQHLSPKNMPFDVIMLSGYGTLRENHHSLYFLIEP